MPKNKILNYVPKDGFLLMSKRMFDSPAFRSLSSSSIIVYLLLVRRFNGYNNGEIALSCRDCAKYAKIVRCILQKKPKNTYYAVQREEAVKMLLEGIQIQNSILETAMQGNMIRKDAIVNNIANADTPKYKRRVVAFEESLKTTLRRTRQGERPDLSGVRTTIRQVNTGLKYRLDGNNVDMEVEMIQLYETSVRYDVLANSVMNNFKRINSVFAMR